MEDMLIWIVLLFIAWIAEGIASARRKQRRKAQERQARERPAPTPRPRRPTEPARQPPLQAPAPRRPEPPSRIPEGEPAVLVPPEVIILRRPAPEELAVPEGSWAEGATRKPTVREDATLEREPTIASLETLEPAGGASHVAFHEKYLDRPPPPRSVRRRLQLGRNDVRRGIVLAEILGRPKSER